MANTLYQLIDLEFKKKGKRTALVPCLSADLPKSISFGAQWTNPLENYPHEYTYTVPQNNVFVHLEFINGDWYCIYPTEHSNKIYWSVSSGDLIDTTDPLHPAHFTREHEPSPDTPESPKKSLFPDPNTLEASHTSPGMQLVEELQQAPIFQDIAEPTEQDQKGKSIKAYLPLSSSP